MKVLVEKYDPKWAEEFKKNKLSLEAALNGVPYVSIEHVGSTSIPGLCAKPVIDIDIVIDPSSLAAARAALVKAGYPDLGELGIPGRYVFRQPGYGADQPATGERAADGSLRRNTYLMIDGCPSLRNHLDCKRILLEDDALREEYGSVKWSLASMDFEGVGHTGIDRYTDAKNKVMWKILRKAGWTDQDLAGLPS